MEPGASHSDARRLASGENRATGKASRYVGEKHLTYGEMAWLLSVPCALLTAAAMALLGGLLGDVLIPGNDGVDIVPEWRVAIFLKPAQEARYFIAVAAPLLFAIPILAKRRPRLTPRTVRALIDASQATGAAFVAVCVWAQHRQVFESRPHSFTEEFSNRTLLVAAGFATAVLLVIKSTRARRHVATALNDQRLVVAVIVVGVAILATAIWVVAGVNFDGTVRYVAGGTLDNLQAPVDEVFAVLDGRTPFVNFIPLYGWLWPYLTALVMSVFGTTFTVFSLTTCTITLLSLLAVFAVVRRVTGSVLGALLLYLPFLATSLFYIEPPSVNRYGPVLLYPLFPLRYAGPYLLVWLVARHLDGARPRWRWLLFGAGGLVVLNNTDFGIPAFGATVAALVWSAASPRAAAVARVLRDALAGLFAAYALVSIMTLLRAGSLVHLGSLFFFARLLGASGFSDLPTPTLGVHVVIYLTYAAAIGTATVRAVRRDPGRLLTGLLVWSGIFGLGVGAYYMSRTNPEALVMMFSAWTLALVFLTIAVIQELVRGSRRRLTIADCVVVFGMSVAACSLAQMPVPWAQIKRLEARGAPVGVASPALRRTLVAYGGGKPEAILGGIPDRVAYEAGIVDVSPYIGMVSIFTVQQFDETLCALHAAGGQLLVLPIAGATKAFWVAAEHAGFTLLGSSDLRLELSYTPSRPVGFTLWSAPALARLPCGSTRAAT
jgi:hypothetical protein